MKIGIDIGGSHIAIGVVNNNGNIIEKTEKRLTSIEKKNLEKSIEEYIIENAVRLKQKYDITNIGIAIPGSSENGIVISSGNLEIKNYPLAEILQKEIHLPISIQNDAKCAGIAENKYGCLKGYNASLFLTLGTGIGGAVFLNNKLLKGTKKLGYEFGHMVIEKDGMECICGRKGCFERYASMKAFKTNLRNKLGMDEKTDSHKLLEIILETKPEDNKYKIINDVIEEYIDYLSIGIINLIEIFEPEVIGLGGSFVYFKDIFLPKLKEKINREDIEIKTADLGNEAGIIGATL